MPNSTGKTNKEVRRFLRECGEKPNVANVERVGREIRRTRQEHERHEAVSREIERATGRPDTIDAGGDVKARMKARVQAELARREKEGR